MDKFSISKFFWNLQLLDESKCREVVLELLHPNGPACPHCGAGLEKRHSERWKRNERCRCKICRRKFSATTGTVFNSLKIPFAEAVTIRFMIEGGYRSNQIKRRIHRTTETIRTVRRRFQALENMFDG